MGGALTAALAQGHPELAGIVLINAPAAVPDEMAAAVEEMMAGGMEVMDSIGGDIADPDADEASYGETPLRPLLTMIMAGKDVRRGCPRSRQPTLIITSRQDHVVNPEDSDVLADEHLRPGRAPVAREELPRRHPRLRPGRARGGRRRLRPEGHRRLSARGLAGAGLEWKHEPRVINGRLWQRGAVERARQLTPPPVWRSSSGAEAGEAHTRSVPGHG